MTGRYAVAFLFLDMPPDQVDVNVHPTKAEVRFRESQSLYHLVLAAIRERLRKENLTPRLHAPNGETASSSFRPMPQPAANQGFFERGQFSPIPMFPFNPIQDRPRDMLPPDGAGEQPAPGFPIANSQDQLGQVPTGFPERGKAIQFHDSYIVLETPEGMLVIDQHALHERILFEQLKNRFRTGQLEKQKLLIPEPVDLPAEQAAKVLEQRDALAELGVGVEDFGGGTILLTSYPAILSRRSPLSILQAIIDHLMTKDRIPGREVLLGDLLSLMACHGAVRAGDRLTPEEISALVAQRELANDTHHCPHGRPTSLLFSKQELDRQFRRV
jgi:DNA mismatch repair protein MutL